MIAELGRFALVFALVCATASVIVGWWAQRTNRDDLLGYTGRALTVCAAATAVAFFALVNRFLASDFSLAVVTANSHIDKPWGYKLVGTWGNHEGSMLLWCFALAGSAALVARSGDMSVRLKSQALAVLGAVTTAYLAFAAFASDPFARLDPAPWQGAGLNPLLQDPALAAHPPLLYLGYVGLAAPFAIAVAALWSGEDNAAWARAMRPWVLAAFAFLTIGIALGSFWAYYELGWGGWWFWDPVENASFMPWLAAAALAHSVIVTEKRGALGGWTALLAIIAFSFSMLGAFLVRSGVLTSVHAFALDPERGAFLLAILAVFAGGALAVFAWRGGAVAGLGRTFEIESRETAIVANNVFLLAAAAVILLGTLYPLIHEAFAGTSAAVGPPYFEIAALPLMAAPLLLTPIAVLMPWGRGRVRPTLLQLRIAAVTGVGALVGVLALANGAPVGAAVTVAIGGWLIAGAITDVARFARPRWRVPASVMAAALAHAGVGVFALGAGADRAFPIEHHLMMQPGDTATVGPRTVRFVETQRVDGSNYVADRAVIVVQRGDGPERVLTPERRFYPQSDQSTSEVALRARLSGDLYVALGGPQLRADGGEVWPVRVMVNPLSWMIFGGAFLTAVGAFIGMFDRRAAAARRPAPAQSAPAPAPTAAE